MLSFTSVLGLVFTLVGALIGAKGYWKEKESTYYGRANFYFFNLEYYSSMIVQKYKSIIAFVYIALGTTMQISIYIFNTKLAYEIDLIWKVIIIFLFVLIWFISEKCIEVLAWNTIKKRIVKDYYSQTQSGELSEKQLKERWENLYYVFRHGKNNGSLSIDQEELIIKINKYLKKNNDFT